MKKFYFMLIFCLTSGGLSAQVGIRTTDPKGMFHVDGKNDNQNTNSDKYSNDFIITNDGNVGIGTISPTSNLHIEGKPRINPGAATEDYMLVCENTDGDAVWKPQKVGNLIGPNQDIDALFRANDLNFRTQQPVRTGASITLPPGNYQLYFTATFRNESRTESLNIWWDFLDHAGNHPGVNPPQVPELRVVSSTASGRNKLSNRNTQYAYNPVTAIYFIDIDVETTFHLWAMCRDKSSDGSAIRYVGQAALWAMPIGASQTN